MELKEIRKATTEEVEKIAKENWESERMQEYLKNTYDFYILKDGFYFEIDKASKIGIEKTMWYDDETEAPENNEANFILYNMQMHDPTSNLEEYLKQKHELETRGCAIGHYDYKGLYIEKYRTDTNEIYINYLEDKRGQTIRYLTQAEAEDFIAIKRELRAKYLERLQKYYKRYSKHVHASGYWANR